MAADLVIRAIDRTRVAFREINQRMRGLFGPLRNLNARFRAFANTNFGRLAGGLSSIGKKLGSLAKGAAVFAGAGIAAFAALTKASVDAGDGLGKAAKRAGLTVDEFFSLQQAAAGAGIEAEKFGGAMDTFVKSVGGAKLGKGKLAGFLKEVSPNLLNAVKGAQSTEGALNAVFTALDRIKDPGKRAALATAAFGEAGAQIASLVDDGTDSLDRQRESILALYGSQQKFVDGASAMDDALDDLGKAANASSRKFMTELFPGLTAVASAFTGLISKSSGGESALGKTLNQGLLNVAAKLPSLFTEVRVRLSALAPLAKDLGKVFGFALGVVVKVGSEIFTGITNILGLYAPLKASFMAVFEGIKQGLGGIAEAFQAAFRLDLSGVQTAFKKVTAAFEGKNNPAQAFREARTRQLEEQKRIRAEAAGEDPTSFGEPQEAQQAPGQAPATAPAGMPAAAFGPNAGGRPTLNVTRPSEQHQAAAGQDLGVVISRAIAEGFTRVAAAVGASGLGGAKITVSFVNTPRGAQIKSEGRANVELNVGYVPELAR